MSESGQQAEDIWTQAFLVLFSGTCSKSASRAAADTYIAFELELPMAVGSRSEACDAVYGFPSCDHQRNGRGLNLAQPNSRHSRRVSLAARWMALS